MFIFSILVNFFSRFNGQIVSNISIENENNFKTQLSKEDILDWTISILIKNNNNNCGVQTLIKSYNFNNRHVCDFIYINIFLLDGSVVPVTIRVTDDFLLFYQDFDYSFKEINVCNLEKALKNVGLINDDYSLNV